MTVINTNIGATIARNAIGTNERAMATSMERLSTGLRINSAKDDAAGLAIASRMTAQVSTLNMGVRNANDAISMLQTVEGASKEISNMLVRMKELAVQANSETYSTTDTDALDLEYQALLAEITRVQANTKWNDMALMDNTSAGTANTVSVQLGDSAKDVTIKDWSITGSGSVLNGLSGTAITDTTRTDATTKATAAITALDAAITAATTEQATYGSEIASLTHAADNLTNVSANTDQSRSRIQDADYAVETTNLARTQIIAQASTAMLAQANQSKQSVLALLR
ncbi:flagellin [Gammaproteobacteria bacterium]|nr:flagellin [Gammaproteobacteria bacterium]